jgi:hypothetical protein
VTVKNYSNEVVSHKWMDYDSNGNLLTEEVCRTDSPATGCTSRNASQDVVTTYSYCSDGTGNVCVVTDPREFITTITYDDTRTFVYQKKNALGHVTTTMYDPGTGKVIKMVPPRLHETSLSFDYTYEAFGRLQQENRPDGGWTAYAYVDIGKPSEQYVLVTEHIEGGSNPPPDRQSATSPLSPSRRPPAVWLST